MEVIINDFSLDGQFEDEDKFIESLYENTLPVIKELEGLKFTILRSYNSYNSNVTSDKTLNEILKIKGNPEITKLKGLMSKLFMDDPYWNDDVKSIEEIYSCDFTNEKSKHCLSEALEREAYVLSFEHEKFKESSIKINRNSEEKFVSNLFNKRMMLEIFRESRVITDLEFIILKYSLNNSFGLEKGKNYFKELVDDAVLSLEDQSEIVSDIDRLINLHMNNENPGRLSDTIDGKLKEFRTSLTNNRQIRFFYIEKNNKIIFLNGFLKKTQKTPNDQIDKAKKIMVDYLT